MTDHRWYERPLIAFHHWLYANRFRSEKEAFEQRLNEDPHRERIVQEIRLKILQHDENSTAAALEIVEYFMPKK